MHLRWLVILALYTLLIGPILDAPWGRSPAKARSQARVAAPE